MQEQPAHLDAIVKRKQNVRSKLCRTSFSVLVALLAASSILAVTPWLEELTDSSWLNRDGQRCGKSYMAMFATMRPICMEEMIASINLSLKSCLWLDLQTWVMLMLFGLSNH